MQILKYAGKTNFYCNIWTIRENLGFLVDLAKDDLCKLQSC